MAKSEKDSLLWLNPENGRDCFAVALGYLAGCVWWVIHHNNFVRLYWEFVPVAQAKGFVPEGFDGVYTALNLATIMVQSLCVGFVTSLFARRKPYRLAYIALLATFTGRIPASLFEFSPMSQGPRHASEPSWIIWIYFCVYGLVTGLGAFIPQIFKSFCRLLFKPLNSREIKPIATTSFSSSVSQGTIASLGNSLLTTIGITILLSILLKSCYLISMPFYYEIGYRLNFNLTTGAYALWLLCGLAQAFTIGFCVARCVPLLHFHFAIGAALLALAVDLTLLVPRFFGRGETGLTPVILFFLLGSCGVAACGGAYKALVSTLSPVNP